MHVFVWNSIQFVKSNNIEIRQIELNFKQKMRLYGGPNGSKVYPFYKRCKYFLFHQQN